MLLQDEIILKEFQDWYTTSLDSIDTSNDEGKKLEISILIFRSTIDFVTLLKYISYQIKNKKRCLKI